MLMLLQVLLLLLVMLCALRAALVVMIRWHVLAVIAIEIGRPWQATINAVDRDDVTDICRLLLLMRLLCGHWLLLLLVLAGWLLCWLPLVQHWYSQSSCDHPRIIPANG